MSGFVDDYGGLCSEFDWFSCEEAPNLERVLSRDVGLLWV